jgi:hypothetical protein
MRGLVIGEHPDQPVLSAGVAVIALDPATAWSETVSVTRMTAKDVEVHLTWDASGRSNLARLRSPPDPTEPAREPRPWAFEVVDLSGGVVSLTWPTWGLHFDAVSCAGSIRRSPPEGLVIAADLEGAEASLRVDDRVQRFDAHAIEGFEWRSRALEAKRVAVSSTAGAELMLAGEMGFDGGTSADLRGHATLPADAGDELFTQWLPQGGGARAITVSRMAGAPWSFGVTEAVIPTLSMGDWQASGLAASFDAEVGRGGVVPSLGLHTEGATAQSIAHGTTWRADGVRVGSVNLNLGMATEAKISALKASDFEFSGERVTSPVFEGGLVANMGGGALNASLTTAMGTVTVSGPIETSLLRRRVGAQLSWRFADVQGGLAGLLRRALPAGDTPDDSEVLDGRATSRLGVAASGPVTWSWTHVVWTGGEP